MITMRFSGRTPTPMQVPIGMETDQKAEKMRFVLPQISDTQAAQLCLMLPDDTPEVLNIRDGQVTLPGKVTEIPGRSRAWVEILGEDTVAWNSEIFYLEVGDLPPISERTEQTYPTALQEALAAGLRAERFAEAAQGALNIMMACGGLFSARIEDETLYIDRVSITDQRAYEIAVLNGFEGTEEEWDEVVETLGGNIWAEELQESIEDVQTLAQQAKDRADECAVAKEYDLTIAVADWTGDSAPYTAVKQVTGIKAGDKLIIGVGESADASALEAIAQAVVVCVSQAADSVTFKAYEEKPDVAVPVNIIALEG